MPAKTDDVWTLLAFYMRRRIEETGLDDKDMIWMDKPYCLDLCPKPTPALWILIEMAARVIEEHNREVFNQMAIDQMGKQSSNLHKCTVFHGFFLAMQAEHGKEWAILVLIAFYGYYGRLLAEMDREKPEGEKGVYRGQIYDAWSLGAVVLENIVPERRQLYYEKMSTVAELVIKQGEKCRREEELITLRFHTWGVFALCGIAFGCYYLFARRH